VTVGVCRAVCMSAEPLLRATLVSVAKVMHCIQCSLVRVIYSRDCVAEKSYLDLFRY